MRTEFVDRSHPLLIWRIVGTVGDFSDFTKPPPCRLEAFPPLFLRFLAELSIRSQARWWKWPGFNSSAFGFINELTSSWCRNGWITPLFYSNMQNWAMRDSNPRHPACKGGMLEPFHAIQGRGELEDLLGPLAVLLRVLRG